MADDYGRFEATPTIVKSTCFPLGCKESITDVKRCLQILADSNVLILYKNNEREYGQFVNFTKHQGEPRAKKSKYPEPPCEQIRADSSRCSDMLPSSVSDSESEIRIPNESFASDPPLPPKVNGRAVKTPWPVGFVLTEKMADYARSQGISNPMDEFDHFHDSALAKGYKYLDWERAWQNWCRSPYQQATKQEDYYA